MTTTNDRPSGGAEAAELFTVEQLTEISQNQDPVANDLAGDHAALVPEMIKGGIVTKNQITAFLANVCVETDHLNTLEEYGDEDYFRYGPPHGSGIYLGDEWMYHGRGYIQLTWSDNYRDAGQGIGVGDRLVNEPDLVATNKELAAKTAVWYWTSRDCGTYADQEDFEAVCSLINRGEVRPTGPINHWDQRLEFYERAKSVIGIGAEPVIEPAREGRETEVSADWPTRWAWVDKKGWVRDWDTEAYLRLENWPSSQFKTDSSGFQFTTEKLVSTPESAATAPETVATPTSTWTWPEAWDDPIPWSDSYWLRHPTRYVWRPDIEVWARWLVDNFSVWCNSYYEHPEGRGFEVASTDPDGTVWYIENTSLDVWGLPDRGTPLGTTLGWQIFYILMNDPNPPNIHWIIWQETQYGEWNGWQGEPFGVGDPIMNHNDHIHVSYW